MSVSNPVRIAERRGSLCWRPGHKESGTTAMSKQQEMLHALKNSENYMLPLLWSLPLCKHLTPPNPLFSWLNKLGSCSNEHVQMPIYVCAGRLLSPRPLMSYEMPTIAQWLTMYGPSLLRAHYPSPPPLLPWFPVSKMSEWRVVLSRSRS